MLTDEQISDMIADMRALTQHMCEVKTKWEPVLDAIPEHDMSKALPADRCKEYEEAVIALESAMTQ